jgi:hypothetical protein
MGTPPVTARKSPAGHSRWGWSRCSSSPDAVLHQRNRADVQRRHRIVTASGSKVRAPGRVRCRVSVSSAFTTALRRLRDRPSQAARTSAAPTRPSSNGAGSTRRPRALGVGELRTQLGGDPLQHAGVDHPLVVLVGGVRPEPPGHDHAGEPASSFLDRVLPCGALGCEACRPAAAVKVQGPEEPTLLTAARIGPEGPEEPTLLTAARIGPGRSPRSRTQRKLRSPAALASVDSGALHWRATVLRPQPVACGADRQDVTNSTAPPAAGADPPHLPPRDPVLEQDRRRAGHAVTRWTRLRTSS